MKGGFNNEKRKYRYYMLMYILGGFIIYSQFFTKSKPIQNDTTVYSGKTTPPEDAEFSIKLSSYYQNDHLISQLSSIVKSYMLDWGYNANSRSISFD